MGRTLFIVLLFTSVGLSPASTVEEPRCANMTMHIIIGAVYCCPYRIPFSEAAIENCDKDHDEFQCGDDCLLANDGLLGTDKRFNHSLWETHIKKVVHDPDWIDLMIGSPKSCSGFQPHLGFEKYCESGADELFFCMSLHWYMNCPKSVKISSPLCENLKKKILPCFSSMFKN
uniref:Odorant-binding protein 10 n=1 Tax=Helopeltis theivora TaxID=393766 RepID=A0A6B9RVF0_9HEMI|nr:odorant-binding protein 10 [Helopeltis theivora]